MWTTTGPATKAMRSPACLAARIIAAIRDTPTSTRRSDEISLVMNAKPWRSRSWNSGTILMPWMPQTIASPLRISRSLRQIARAALDHDRGVHALLLDLHPLAAEAHRRLMVGGGVEVLRRAAVAIGGDDVRVLGARDAAAERDQLLEHLGQRRRRLRGHAHRHERRLVVGAADAELEHVERRVVADDGVEHRVHELRVDEVAFGLDHLGARRR